MKKTEYDFVKELEKLLTMETLRNARKEVKQNENSNLWKKLRNEKR